jgi:tRNA threonylcarbamoyladenosine biosynthesis protein TsaB
MNLLAFDSATELLAVAVTAQGLGHTRVVPGGAAASAALLPLAHALLAEAGLEIADLQAIAFGRGPGAFTGLRTSCAVAQGLALGLGCPVLPVDSLLIVAEDARVQVGLPAGLLDVGVAMDARMGEIYAARWCWQPAAAAWDVLESPRVTSPHALAQAWSGDGAPSVVAGSALDAFGDQLPLPPGTRRLPTEHDRAGALLRLALAAQAAGQGVDAALALPLYVRDKVAQTTAERAALAAARLSAQAHGGGPGAAAAP